MVINGKNRVVQNDGGGIEAVSGRAAACGIDSKRINDTPGQNADWRIFHINTHYTRERIYVHGQKYGRIICSRLVYYFLSKYTRRMTQQLSIFPYKVITTNCTKTINGAICVIIIITIIIILVHGLGK